MDRPLSLYQPLWAAALRLAIFAMVERLQPVARCIVLQDCLAASMLAMLSLRYASSGRPL
jgi:hypothetical protein